MDQHLKKKKNDNQQYGQELQMENDLRNKQREIERFQKLNDLENANKKKLEYEAIVNAWK